MMVKVGRHHFHPSEVADWRGEPTCARCPLPAGNEIHQVPEQSDEASELDARRLGEREDE